MLCDKDGYTSCHNEYYWRCSDGKNRVTPDHGILARPATDVKELTKT